MNILDQIPIEVVEKEIARREMAEAAKVDTAKFGELIGLSEYDPERGRVPWAVPGIHGRICSLLDKYVPQIDNPIKIVAVSRGHFKTSVLGAALARKSIQNPGKRSAIFAAKENLAMKTLKQVTGILKNKKTHEHFSDVLHPTDNREAYQRKEIYLDHERIGGEANITVMGMESSFTGWHFDNVLWVDDLIDKHMAQSESEMNAAFESLVDLMGAVADPGCEIWLSFTRYKVNDPYDHFLREHSDFEDQIVESPIVTGCYEDELNDEGDFIPIFPMRFCTKKSEVNKKFVWNGKEYKHTRKSLEAIRSRFGPTYFSAQYLNSPISIGDSSWDTAWFDDVLDVDGINLAAWLDKPENAKTVAPYEENRGELEVAVIGDPAYGDRAHNDFAVLWVIAQDKFNHWYLLDYVRRKYGKHRIDEYILTALKFYKDYGARWLAIEAHGTGVMLEAAIRRLEIQEGVRTRKKELKKNSNIGKEHRIMSLEPQASAGRLHFCRNVDAGRKQAALEAMTYRHGGTDDVIETISNGTQVFRVNDTEDDDRISLIPTYGRGNPLNRVLGGIVA